MAKSTLQRRGALLTGAGLGAGLMYFLDPQVGRRRRALARDRIVHFARVGGEAVGVAPCDLMHRMSAAAARLKDVTGRRPVDDAILRERVRAQLGRVLRHPRAIDVAVRDGIVTVRGPVLRQDLRRLHQRINRLRGVREVVYELDQDERTANQ